MDVRIEAAAPSGSTFSSDRLQMLQVTVNRDVYLDGNLVGRVVDGSIQGGKLRPGRLDFNKPLSADQLGAVIRAVAAFDANYQDRLDQAAAAQAAAAAATKDGPS